MTDSTWKILAVGFLFLYRSQEFITVEMDHMFRNFGNPHLCFPGDIVCVSLKLTKIRERADINPSGMTFSKYLFQFDITFRRNRAMRGDCLNQKQEVSGLIIENHVGEFVVLGYRDTQGFQHLLFHVQKFMGCVTHIEEYRIWTESGFELLKDFYLKFIVLSGGQSNDFISTYWKSKGVPGFYLLITINKTPLGTDKTAQRFSPMGGAVCRNSCQCLRSDVVYVIWTIRGPRGIVRIPFSNTGLLKLVKSLTTYRFTGIFCVGLVVFSFYKCQNIMNPD